MYKPTDCEKEIFEYIQELLQNNEHPDRKNEKWKKNIQELLDYFWSMAW